MLGRILHHLQADGPLLQTHYQSAVHILDKD